MYLRCEQAISKEEFDTFAKWYRKNFPDFEGEIRRAADSLWIAEIIDEEQKVKRIRFARW